MILLRNLGLRRLLAVVALTLSLCGAGMAQTRVMILADAIGRWPKLTEDWGYAALIEHDGKRILFDTGGNIAVLKDNAAKLNVDLTHLDMVIVSTSEGDHTAGLRWILAINPKTTLVVPDDPAFRGQELSQELLTGDKEPMLPKEQRYFNGDPTEHIQTQQAFSDVRMTVIRGSMSVAPGMRLVTTMAREEPYRGQKEISLVLETAKGPVIFVGCAHAGIESVMAAAMEGSATPQVAMLVGGLHMMRLPDAQINTTLDMLENRYHVQRVAPGHCTGERALYLMEQRWKKNYVYAGLGETLML